MPTNAYWIPNVEVMATAISTGRVVTAMAVGRTEAVAVEVAAEAEEVAVEEAVGAMVSAEVAVEVAVEAEEVVVATVSPPHAGIRFKTRDLPYTGPGKDSLFILIACRLL
jgi:hypothetical protein